MLNNMNKLLLFMTTVWIYFIIGVKTEKTSFQRSDPSLFILEGEKAVVVEFNSIPTVSICTYEDNLRDEWFCRHQCRQNASSLSYPDLCPGTIRYCWFKKRNDYYYKAHKDWMELQKQKGNENTRRYQNKLSVARSELTSSGDKCFCLCERTEPKPILKLGELIDSICFDPVSVPADNKKYVATGARFKRHGSVIYLELQYGILANGKVDPNTLKWTKSENCINVSKVVYNFRNNDYDGLKITLEDLTLPDNYVLTGVTLGKSIRGRFVKEDGNVDESKDELTKETQCHESTTDLVRRNANLLPSTPVEENISISQSCKHHITFGGTTFKSDKIVPYVDVQDITVPRPISGIGWYYRGKEGYGGYLALKVLK